MPTFLDFHSLCRFTEDDLKRAQEKPRDEYGVKVLNAFYNIESRMEFCLVDTPDRDGVEKYHAKFGINVVGLLK